ncbi:hypothetical protein S245_008274 [Arachis hypogaea]
MGENEGASVTASVSKRRHTLAVTEALDVRVATVPLVQPTQYVRPSLAVACAAMVLVGTVSARFSMATGDRGVSVPARLHEKDIER